MDSTDSEGNEVLPEKVKVPKHLIEKKRRARINNCLGELKKLVIEKDFLKGQRSSKLEKADILELTVDFLKRKAKLPYPVLESLDVRDLQTKLYARGYRECLDQVSKYLKCTDIKQSVGDTLLNELETVAQKMISKNAKLSDKHVRSVYADGKSHNGLTKIPPSDCSDHAIHSMATEEEMHLGTTSYNSKERLAAETLNHNLRNSPNDKQYVDNKWQIASATTLNSIGVIKDKVELPSTSIKMVNGHPSVDSFSTPSIYPMVGSLQSVTVFVPCQVLASAIPPFTTSQYPPFSNVCEHAELTPPFLNHSADLNAVSMNPSYIKIDTVAPSNLENPHSGVVSESTTVPDDRKEEGKDTCLNESISPLPSPWRPW
ncbi:hairy/enhancer-of-split related with YRPW motif protein 1-like [Mizuhopecten yessoensis]|uniref:Transcription factor HES-4-B n=1 Tax=Mizuhopecten yessoensis TaxID=6573 RepID=A0A210PXK0_MIZYE|nr:hairy/enhancer-of-split related with YRPW motif protein 1-like [Mizuhopecten yessoensis]OWF41228.1 Transcription factor HES-4-B [Mizuhopecten yessoensis]